MRFNEFVNRNKNIIGASNSKRISESIEITDTRDKFYSGELFKKYDIVESEGKLYRILEQCSNYFQVVDTMGNISRKFAKNLTIAEDVNEPNQFATSHISFHGYMPTDVFQESAAAGPFRDTINKVNDGKISDDIAVLKALKSVDAMVNHIQDFLNSHTHEDQTQYNAHVLSHFAIARECLTKIGEYIHHEDYLEDLLSMLQTAEAPNMATESTEYKPKDKMVVAKIIADAIGVEYDVISTPDNLVNAALRKAKKDPVLMRNKALIQNMVQIAKDVGIRINDSSFEIKEEYDVDEAYIGSALSAANANAEHARQGNSYKGSIKVPVKHVGGVSDYKSIKRHLTSHGITSEIGTTDNYKTVNLNSNHHTTGELKKKLGINEQIEELNVNTLKSYSDKAKASAHTLVAQGAKSKKPETSYSKFKKATKRFDNAAKADKRVFSKEWKQRTMQSEAVESDATDYDTEKQVMGYHELKRRLEMMSGIKDISKEPAEAPKDAEETQANDPSGPSDLPHGHSLHPSSETHRKQLIKKLKGD